MEWLTVIADIGAILTAGVAVVGGGYLWRDRRGKQTKLENYLKAEKQNASRGDKGQRSILHLMARLGMTEGEVLQASFRSKCIERRLSADDKTGRATAMLLEYEVGRS
jgi:hypothetical protein